MKISTKYGQDGVLNLALMASTGNLLVIFQPTQVFLTQTRLYKPKDDKGDSFQNGPTDADSGYFMALKDVYSGAKVEDTSDVTSNWIRIADKAGKDFRGLSDEIHDHNSLKFNSKGESMVYLKGDVIKVQAHWNDPNSSIFVASPDVPRKIS